MTNVIDFPLNRLSHLSSDNLWKALRAIAAPSSKGDLFTLTVSIDPQKGPTFSVVYPEGKISRHEVADYLRAAAKAMDMPYIKL